MGRTNGGVPGKRPKTEQVENVNNPAEVDSSGNVGLSQLRIGSARLFLQATEQTRMALCISDPQQEDCPIVYVNEAFVQLTGYPREEIVGRNCRFLQGEGTDPTAVDRLRTAIEGEEYRVVDLLNYRKDGEAFWNAVHVGPIYDENGDLAYFYGSQWDITDLLNERDKAERQDRLVRELRHRTENLFAVINAIVRLSARGETDVGALTDKITSRVEALASAHRVSLSPEGLESEQTDLRHLVEEVMKPYRNRNEGRIRISGQLVELPRASVTPVGLTLHELATNALKYGALSVEEGEVEIDWSNGSDWVSIHWIERGGPSANGSGELLAPQGGGTGTRLIDGVLRGIGGEIESELGDTGFEATVRIPSLGQVSA